MQAVKLTGAYDNDTASWPVITYLFGPDANQACSPAMHNPALPHRRCGSWSILFCAPSFCSKEHLLS